MSDTAGQSRYTDPYNAEPAAKRCTKCYLLKHHTEYYKDDRTKDGLAYQCKQCRIDYQAARAGSVTRLEANNKAYFEELLWWRSMTALWCKDDQRGLRNLRDEYERVFTHKLSDEDGWPSYKPDALLSKDEQLQVFMKRSLDLDDE